MFAFQAPLPHVPLRYNKRRIPKVCRSYYTVDKTNSKDLNEVVSNDLLHVLTFHQPNVEEGIYSIRRLNDKGIPFNHILAFITFEDAFRYKTLLDAEMHLSSYVQFASRYELNHACEVGNYKCRVINEGVLVTPPTETIKITDWERRSSLLNGRWSVRKKD
jgi:hypothetical protein|tara:strand:+ start:80 stop:562 length:483 start_codon:yes stop_codon:yes gene_type:complete